MKEIKIFAKDISELKEFEKYGATFTCIDYNPTHNTYLYERSDGGYEIVKPRKRKNPDGNFVYVYPSSDQFGFGVALYTPIYDKAVKYLNNGLQRITE